MIEVHNPLLLASSSAIHTGAREQHPIEKVTDVKARTDDTVSFKLDGVEYSATFDDVPMRQRFIRNAMQLGILEVA